MPDECPSGASRSPMRSSPCRKRRRCTPRCKRLELTKAWKFKESGCAQDSQDRGQAASSNYPPPCLGGALHDQPRPPRSLRRTGALLSGLRVAVHGAPDRGHDAGPRGGRADRRARRNWPGQPRADALSLRLAGALHAAALSGRDPALAAEYPATRTAWQAGTVWRAARAFLAREREWVGGFLPPPADERDPPRDRAACGLPPVAARFDLPFDMLEIGASAGFDQFWDRFAHRTGAWTWGPAARRRSRPTGGGRRRPWTPTPGCGRARPATSIRSTSASRGATPPARVRLGGPGGPPRTLRRGGGDRPRARRARGARRRGGMARGAPRPTRARRAHRRLPLGLLSVPAPGNPRTHRDGDPARGRAAAAPLAWLRLEPEAVLGGPRDSVRFLIDLITWPGPNA